MGAEHLAGFEPAIFQFKGGALTAVLQLVSQQKLFYTIKKWNVSLKRMKKAEEMKMQRNQIIF